MLMSAANNIKLYNLTSGKSLPDWIESKKKLSKAERWRNIQLLQDFDMPVVSNKVQVSRDGQYICTTGTYKPRMKCFEVEQLSMKFERCFDSEAVAFEILSDDYSKMVFLQCDRHVEIHAQHGRYYRLRIPKFGRDLCYHPSTCDTYFVGDGANIFRLNLEQGRFLNPFTTGASSLNVCEVNQEHHLLAVGSSNGTVEAWDPRSRQSVGMLNCTIDDVEEHGEVTALAFRDGIHFGVGLSTGQVLLYDLRSSKPILVKDHMYGYPIKKIAFHQESGQENELVLSMDSKVVKIWERETGKAFTAIESEHNLNDMAIYPKSGLILLANEQPKLQVHFIPSLDPAPWWCSFLDNVTEELEESDITEIFDDYKFVTKEELYDIGLDHLIGSELLRAYMHGYFMNVKLYQKAADIAGSVRTENDIIKDKVKSEIMKSRTKLVNPKRDNALPNINKDLYLKLQHQKMKGKKKENAGILEDDRFSGLFTDNRFAIDTSEEAYRLLNPVISKLDVNKAKEIESKLQSKEESESGNEEEEDDIVSENDYTESSSEDEEVVQKVKREFKQIQKEDKGKSMMEQKFKMYNLGSSDTLGSEKKQNRKSLLDRIKREEETKMISCKDGHQMTFLKKKSRKEIQQELKNKAHRAERQTLRRSTGHLKMSKSKRNA